MATATLDPQLKTEISRSVSDLFDPFRSQNYFIGYGKITGTGQTTRTETNDTLTRKNILVAQQISPADVALVIPRVDWTSGNAYDEFDPSEDMSTKSFYVYNPDNQNIYICVTKGSGNSTSQPTVINAALWISRSWSEVETLAYPYFIIYSKSVSFTSGVYSIMSHMYRNNPIET